jgi:S-adenosylmethionine-diacylglycerol 3-amino-3-carboxypropyl transferase
MSSEVQERADFSAIRYAQVWEDADILLEALNPGAGKVCLSIASAGDNALALLARGPERVIAIDMNPAQLACLKLRVAAYRRLSHSELLEFVGSRESGNRADLYGRCRAELDESTQKFWDGNPLLIADGIGAAGKFERYFRKFRERVLPLIHPRERIRELLQPGKSREERETYYEARWNTWRWRLLFKVFFSRFVMGRMGRDPAFFKYVEGAVSDRIFSRARYALTALDPAENPYLQWILCGHHQTALPFALRPENFETIRQNLARLEIHEGSIESYLSKYRGRSIDCFNLSDIFEYQSPESSASLLRALVDRAASGARLAYWNMLVPRRRPADMAGRVRSLGDLENRLFAADKAFFYSAFVVEEIL